MATVFKVSDVGIASATEAGTDVRLLGSDRQTYQPVPGCTSSGLPPVHGARRPADIGCAVFQLPSGG